MLYKYNQTINVNKYSQQQYKFVFSGKTNDTRNIVKHTRPYSRGLKNKSQVFYLFQRRYYKKQMRC